MSADLMPFDYGDATVRTILIAGEPWFVLADLCKVLGISDTSIVRRRLDDALCRTHPIADGLGRIQNATLVNEPGMYEVVIRSDKPGAVAFRRWLTGTVLPEIRKTGSYAVELDLSDPLAVIEAESARVAKAVEIARGERIRADKAEMRLAAEQKRRAAIEGGDGIDLTTFGKKYFSEVRKTDFEQHLYDRGYLIDQRNTRMRADGSVTDGYDHRKPTAKGREFIYSHDQGTYGGRRRFAPRVRPQMEIALRDALAAEGLPVNKHSTGLVLLTDDDLKELGA